MTDPIWPEDLPDGLMSGYRYRDRDARSIQDTAGGFPMIRPGPPQVIRDYWFTLQLTDVQLIRFEHFYERSIDGGSLPFVKSMRTGSGMNAETVQFLSRSDTRRRGNRWQVQCQVYGVRSVIPASISESLPAWPVRLGLINDYRYQDRSQLITESMKSGVAEARRRAKFTLRDHHFVLRLTDQDQATFDLWWDQDLWIGSRYFTLPLSSSVGLNQAEVFVVKRGETKLSRNRWETSFQVATDNRHELKLPDDVVDFITSPDGADVTAISEELHQVVHEDIP